MTGCESQERPQQYYLEGESAGAVWHHSRSLSAADGGAEVGLRADAEDALRRGALGRVTRHHMVANLIKKTFVPRMNDNTVHDIHARKSCSCSV